MARLIMSTRWTHEAPVSYRHHAFTDDYNTPKKLALY
jgi:hypothetical protein